MKIIDTYDSIFSAYDSGVFDKKLWDNYASSAFTGLKTKVEQDFSRLTEYKDKINTILNDVPKNIEAVETAHQSFVKVTQNLSDRIKDKLNIDLDVTIILYLGLGNGAGWATTVNNQKVVLIGIEKVIELGWCSENDMQDLIYHELGHIYHSRFERKELFMSKRKRAVQQLYREGVAMVFEQILCNDNRRFHQNVNGWLSWCKENEDLIKTEYLNRLNHNESIQDFFGDWCSFLGYSDVGYYLGTVFVRFLMNNYSLQEIASMKVNKVYKEFVKFVNQ